ncbi:MAG: hypothetical protein ACK4Z5_04465 [Brevundimonas sp.]
MFKTALAAALLFAAPAAAQDAPAAGAHDDHAGHGDHAAHADAQAEAELTIDSPIRDLLANEAAAAVLEKHMPGVAQHPARAQFEAMTLKQVQPFSQGMITDAMIEAIDADLKAL